MVVTQILSRLPVKSLMRFKSVCKLWKLTIEQDSHFINLHRTRSQARPWQLFTIVFKNRKYSPGEPDYLFDFLLADLGCGDGVRAASVHNSWSIRVSYIDTEDVGLLPFAATDVKGPVRELLCFVNIFNVRIYSISTRQFVTPWIRSAVSRSRYDKPCPICEFGFDPDTGEYKVILVWHDCRLGETLDAVICEVLTVGVDSNWRVVDDVPHAATKREFMGLNSTYANGSIYWMYKGYYGSVSFLAFDIGPEKFRTIMIPKVRPSTLSMFPFELYPHMMELDGCLTVVRTRIPPTLELWKFHDRNKEGTLTHTSERGEDWSEVRIEMPSYIPSSVRVKLHPLHGKDQMMILETYERGDILLPMNMMFNCFYSYNGVNKTFNKFEIQGMHPLGDMDRTRCTVLVQDLLPAAEKKPAKLRLGR
ncbi:Putative F-box protein At1g32420 [Linum grandiflorum]